MTGEQPVRRPSALIALILSCCGYVIWSTGILPARASDTAAQHTDMIPQDDLVVQNEDSAASLPITYSVRISKHQDRIKLRGQVASEEDYKTLIGLVKANFPAVDLTDRVQVKPAGPEGDVKIGGLSFALKLLGYLDKGQASVDDNGLSLEGSASTAVVLTELRKLIDNNKPTGVPLKNIRIAPPSRSWSASVMPNGTVKICGVVPSEAGKQAITDAVHKMFPESGINDNSAVKEDLPERWMKAALHSLKFLHLLDKGSVEITDQTIHLKGAAPNEMAVAQIDTLAAELPSGFALKSEVSAPVMRAGMAELPRLGELLPLAH